MPCDKGNEAPHILSPLKATMAHKTTRQFIETTKKRIDFLYELTKEGYEGTMASLKDSGIIKVVGELIRRGVIKKERKKGGKNIFYYKWTANSEPTPCFYKDVAYVLGERQYNFDQTYRAKKKTKEVVIPKPEIEPVKNLSEYTLAELWAEMQSRGAIIENNHIVVVKREVIA